jgi:hypothetical protein
MSFASHVEMAIVYMIHALAAQDMKGVAVTDEVN